MSNVIIAKSTSEMTASELAAARVARLPLHCQTMAKRGVGALLLTDVEELSESTLLATISRLEKLGWRKFGTYFVRTAT